MTHTVLDFFISLSIFGVCVLALKRNKELSELREKLAKGPDRYVAAEVSGQPLQNAVIPFILK